jgi:hypothetical protein
VPWVVLVIDGKRFDLDQTDASRLIERDELQGLEIRGRIYAALTTERAGDVEVDVDGDSDVRRRLAEGLAGVAGSGEPAVWADELSAIVETLRPS